MKKNIKTLVICFLFFWTAPAPWAVSAEPAKGPVFKPEELEQLVATIALYPDSLVSQILMASTYPLEVVEAERWVKQNKDLRGDALTAALEKQTWDPSVKSLVNFPQVLMMMSEKLDWTQKLGDAFLAQQKEVMETIQKLRKKAQDQGTLQTTEQQVVKVEQQTIIIEPANPQVIYVPTYNPVVVYGAWPYPAYPPYAYYPPGHVAGSNLLSFGLGVAAGAAWGYAWGGCNWRAGDVDIDVNRNVSINQNINRSSYSARYSAQGYLDASGRGTWQHNPADRRGVAYRDQATARQFNRAATPEAVQSREVFRGRAGPPQASAGAATRDIGARGVSDRGGAFQGVDRGSSERQFSSRGSASRQSASGAGGGRGRR